MLKREFLEIMENDEELQQLRKQVYDITGNLGDICFRAGRITLEQWKEQLRQTIKEHDILSK